MIEVAAARPVVTVVVVVELLVLVAEDGVNFPVALSTEKRIRTQNVKSKFYLNYSLRRRVKKNPAARGS